MKKGIRKLISFMLSLCLLMSLFTASVEASGAIEISSLEDLIAIGENMAGSYKLTSNIVLEEDYEYTPLGSSSAPFSGTFDGNGYSIKNLNITLSEQTVQYAGLFATNKGTIKNLSIENISIDIKGICDYLYLGGICGKLYGGGAVQNCSASGKFDLDSTEGLVNRIGGITGETQAGSVENCLSEVEIDYQYAANARIGGITGDITNNSGVVSGCENRGKIYATTTPVVEGTMDSVIENNMKSSSLYVGGIVGVFSAKGSIISCLNTGEIDANCYSGLCVGGILGYYINSSAGTITNSINCGVVTSQKNSHEGFYASDSPFVYGSIAGDFLANGTQSGNFYLKGTSNKASASSAITAQSKTLAEIRAIASESDSWYIPSDENALPGSASHKRPTKINVNAPAEWKCNEEIVVPVSVTYDDGTTDTPSGIERIVDAENLKHTYSYKGITETYQYTIKHKEGNPKNTIVADCVTPGYTGDIYCEWCNILITKGTTGLDPDNHAQGEPPISVNGMPSTCKTPGYTGDLHCYYCSEIITYGQPKDLDLDSHEGEIVDVPAVPATCTTNGLTAGKQYDCCGAYYIAPKTIAKLGHSFGAYSVTKKATTSANGTLTRKCARTGCGIVENKTVYKIKTIKLSTTEYTYSGKAKKPSVTIKDSKGTKLKEGTNYTVSYASGRKNVGKYKVTIKLGGNYSGSKTLYFTINPKKTSVKKVTAGSKKLTVKWSKQKSQATGYEIQYSTSSKFTSKTTKKTTVKSYKTTSKTIKKLKAKKKYYVRIRTYKTVKGKKYYSAWSSKKSKTTKK